MNARQSPDEYRRHNDAVARRIADHFRDLEGQGAPGGSMNARTRRMVAYAKAYRRAQEAQEAQEALFAGARLSEAEKLQKLSGEALTGGNEPPGGMFDLEARKQGEMF